MTAFLGSAFGGAGYFGRGYFGRGYFGAGLAATLDGNAGSGDEWYRVLQLALEEEEERGPLQMAPRPARIAPGRPRRVSEEEEELLLVLGLQELL